MRLIDADKLSDELITRWHTKMITTLVIDIILPVITSQPTFKRELKHKWIKLDDKSRWWMDSPQVECPSCGCYLALSGVHEGRYYPRFCPRCGEYLGGEKDENIN